MTMSRPEKIKKINWL